MTHIVEIVTISTLFWLPIDLLYLYYAGGWVEPNIAILLAELVLLYTLPIFALYRLYRYLKQIMRN